MGRRQLPSVMALDCFIASARWLSFTKAADELALTQSAVSRQVASLEAFLKTSLFERVRQRLILTEEGRAYAAVATRHLDALEAETVKLISDGGADDTLHIGTYPTIGSHWLIPKLRDFADRHPDVPFDLVTAVTPFDLVRQRLDVAIQYGDGHWPGVDAVKLFDREEIAAVCAPSLAEGRLEADKVLSYPLLQLATRDDEWSEWLAARGVDAPPSRVLRFDTYVQLISAARAGLGVALVSSRFVEADLSEGTLCSPFGKAIESDRGYHLIYRKRRLTVPKVRAFVDWVTRR